MAQFLANKEKNKVIYHAIIETVHQRNLFELTSETTEN